MPSKAAADAIKFTVKNPTTQPEKEATACSIDNPEDCLVCGS